MIAHSLLRFFKLHRLGLILLYASLLGCSYFVAFQLRFDFNVPESFALDMIHTVWWVVGLKLALLIAFGQVDCVIAYFRLSDAFQLFTSLLVSSGFFVILWYVYAGAGMPPRAVILSDLLLSACLLIAFRVAMRVRTSSSLNDWFHGDNVSNVIIVGAGEVGAGICSELKNKLRFKMRPVALLDDDVSKMGRYVHGVLVAGSVDQLTAVAKQYQADKIVVAFPSASARRIREVVKMAREAQLPVESVPAITDLLSGRAKITQLHPIDMEDLLGRKKVDLNSAQIQSMLSGKRVMITGAGGSIGRELVAQVLAYAPDALLCLDQAEIAIFDLKQEILQLCDTKDIAQTYVLNINQSDELRTVCADFKPEIIFHAAAHKHVSLMEFQPAEALRNNFLATVRLIRMASDLNVERFIFISTDKAINPSSVMGASKRLGELALLEQQKSPGNQTRFMSVRFGNVLGSSGSVTEIFKQQIKKGGPLTVTDPEAKRFFMTVQEAVGLVLQSATQGQGGEIFVLNMGDSVKIIDIARQMIALSGYQEGEDIEIRFTGLIPGEKLHEEIQHFSEALQPTRHPRVLRLGVRNEATISIDSICAELEIVLLSNNIADIKRTIRRYVPEYTPVLQ